MRKQAEKLFIVWILATALSLTLITSYHLNKEMPVTVSYEKSEPYREFPLEKKNALYAIRYKTETVSLPTLSRGAELDSYKSVMVIITGYCPCRICSGNHGYKTASGAKASHNIVAAPKDVPFGSSLIVPGFENGFYAHVGDRGSAIKWQNGMMKIDVFYETHEEAKNVKVITKGYVKYAK